MLGSEVRIDLVQGLRDVGRQTWRWSTVGIGRILVTGANGQLGRDAVELLADRYEVVAATRAELDVTSWPRVRAMAEQTEPAVILHAAAYTHVDAAESNPASAYRINALGTKNVARAAREFGARLVYISTDYVFDGESERPYKEFDPVRPLNVYGHSKLIGESYAAALCPDGLVLRTSWLYGAGGENFVSTIIRLAASEPELKIVDDQEGTPTWTKELVRQIDLLLERDACGLYHVTGSGACTWYEFAREILRLHGVETPVVPVPTSAFERPAKRPRYSVLENYNLALENSNVMKDWRAALAEHLDESSLERRPA